MRTPLGPVDRIADPEWTRRQREVLDLIVRGQSNAEIAATLGISLDGAKWHVREILQKLGVDSREDAAEYWRRHNGLRPRLWRVARSLVAVPAWAKWVGMGGVAAAAVVVALVLALPRSTETPPASTPGVPSAAPSAATSTTSSPTALPEAPYPGLYPHGTTTGLPVVDQAVAAVTSGDADEVFDLAQYYFTPCMSQAGNNDAPILTSICAPDIAAGTVLSGYFAGPCGPGWVDRDHFQASDISPTQVTASDAYLFAVVRVHALPEYAANPAYAAAQYVAVFQSPGLDQFNSIQGARALAVGEDGVVLLSPRCSYDARDILDHFIGFETDGYVLQPKEGAIHQSLPPTYGPGVSAGVPAVDRAVDAILNKQPLTDDLFHWIAEPCSTNPPGIGGTPQCPDGTPDGTPIERILVGGCEPGPLPRGMDPSSWGGGWRPGGGNPRLYAIVRTAAADVLDGSYTAIVVDGDSLSFNPAYVGIDDQGIVSMFTGACRADAIEWAAQQGGFLLAPRDS